MKILKEKLKKLGNSNYEEGYRIVFFYDDNYSIGEYCKTIEGFMIGFAESDPIIDEEDIPKFVSTDDLLNRYLNLINDINAVAIYNVDGTCIDYKEKNKNKIV